MVSRTHTLRYGPAVAAVIVGVLFAAVDTGSVGNTVSTVLIAVGLIAFIALLGRELGMGERRDRPSRPPDDTV